VDDETARYVEDLALYFEASGMPRIAGRVLGYFLVCEPPHKTAAELSEELGVSRASVSTTTRMLQTAGLVDKVAVPGARSTYFGLARDGFERRFELVVAGFAAFVPIAERGIAQLEARPDGEPAERLRFLRDLYVFFAREMPKVLDRWREERAESEENTP